MAEKQKRYGGTFEWASHNDNCLKGCSHNCRYCYARYNAVTRFKGSTAEEWQSPRLASNWNKTRRKLDGGVMFPTTHDILPRFIGPCLRVIGQHLLLGNKILIVTKPHLFCIEEIIRGVALEHKHLIVFRFTIGSTYDEALSYWEPGAPCFAERLACLRRAHEEGFETSVSAEPLLGGGTPTPTLVGARDLLESLEPYISHSIWFGMLNHAKQRVPCKTDLDRQTLVAQLNGQKIETVRAIYEALKGNPLVRWKESYRKILGLDLADAPELAK